MKCAVAIVLALIGIAMANPVPPLGLGIAGLAPVSQVILPPSSGVITSSVINHGITIPKIISPVIPVLKSPIISVPVLKSPIISVPILKSPIISVPVVKSVVGWPGAVGVSKLGWL